MSTPAQLIVSAPGSSKVFSAVGDRYVILATGDQTGGAYCLADAMVPPGGGFRHGQVIGASSRDGGEVAERPVTPGDIAATIYHHLGVPLDATYTDLQNRPVFIVDEGAPIRELI